MLYLFACTLVFGRLSFWQAFIFGLRQRWQPKRCTSPLPLCLCVQSTYWKEGAKGVQMQPNKSPSRCGSPQCVRNRQLIASQLSTPRLYFFNRLFVHRGRGSVWVTSFWLSTLDVLYFILFWCDINVYKYYNVCIPWESGFNAHRPLICASLVTYMIKPYILNFGENYFFFF